MKLPTSASLQLLMKGTLALAKMERNGIKIDMERLDSNIRRTELKIADLENQLKDSKIWKVWVGTFGRKAKLTAPQQMSTVFFVKLKRKYPSDKLTATGKLKSDESIYSHLMNVPFISNYFKMKKLEKVITTLKNIKREVDPNGFCHPSFDLGGPRTYRSSSSNPNFTNLQTRNKVAKKLVRSVFVPRKPGWLQWGVDYSGIEVKIAYCYHRDPVMKKYLLGQGDMHKDQAMDCYLIDSPDQVSKDARYCAKNKFVFPAFYGSYWAQMAPHLWEAIDGMQLKLEGTDISVKDHLRKKGITKLGKYDPSGKADPERGTFFHHIKEVERRFWEKFKVYDSWKKKWYDQYVREAGFSMLTGFRVNGYHKRNDVINYPVQGAAFHCMVWSIIEIQKWLRETKKKTVLIGEIHDELRGDSPEEEIQEVLTVCKRIMTVDLPKAWKWIITPLDVEVKITSTNWYEEQEWKCQNGFWCPAT